METIASKNQEKFAQNIRNRELETCKICGEATQYLVNIPSMNKQFLAHINCRCERKKLEIQRENKLKQEKLAKIAELKNLLLISRRYENVSFESPKLVIIPVSTRFLSVARDIVKITKKPMKTATEFIFLVQKEQERRM